MQLPATTTFPDGTVLDLENDDYGNIRYLYSRADGTRSVIAFWYVRELLKKWESRTLCA